MDFIDTSILEKKIIDSSKEVYEAGECFHLLVSGGNSIQPILKAIKEHLRPDLTKIYIADERLVAKSSIESNERLVQSLLGEEFDIVSYYKEESPSFEKGMEIFSQLEKIHYAILGTGDDGHICSLFPNHPNLLDEGFFTIVKNSPKPPSDRLSVTFDLLKKCDEGTLLLMGEGKKHLLEDFNESLPYGIAVKEIGFNCCVSDKQGEGL